MNLKGLCLGAFAGSMLLTSCTGPFELTKKIHTWQTSFDQKWMDEAAFLGCVIIPVYGIGALADAIVFNSMEFWGEKNPMAASVTIEKDGTSAKMAYQADGKVRVETENGQVFFLEQTANGISALDAQGNLIAAQ